MESEPYTVNVSSINDFMQCRFRWLCKWVENRVPAEDARALRFGKMLHKLYEYHLGGMNLSMREAVAKVRNEWEVAKEKTTPDTPDWQLVRDALDDLAQMEEPLLLWKDRYPFDVPVLEVEQPFEYPLPYDPSIILRGRPDRVGVYMGRLYHVQNRSLASGVNFPLYLELSKRSYHEHLYAAALAQKYPQWTYGGTFFNLYRKLKYRKKATKPQEARGELGDILHEVSEIFWQHPMGIDLDGQVHKHVMESIYHHVLDMKDTEAAYKTHGYIPPPNEKLNGGPYGNMIDPYYRVLTGEIQLSDDRYFKNREDTYVEVGSSE